MGEIKTMIMFLYEVNKLLSVRPYINGEQTSHTKNQKQTRWEKFRSDTNDLFLDTQQMFSLLHLDVVIKEAFRYSKQH